MSTANQSSAAQTAEEDEREPEQKPQTVGGLSDTVFGLAITLLATSLAITPKSSLEDILRQLGGFAGSFFLIALIWLRRHRLLRWMRHEPLSFTRLNFVLLFLIISYTYILRLLTFSTSSLSVLIAFSLFAILTALVNTTMALLYHMALRAGVVMRRHQSQAQRIRTELLLTSAGFMAATPLILVDWHLSVVLLVVLFVARNAWIQARRWRQPRAAAQDVR